MAMTKHLFVEHIEHTNGIHEIHLKTPMKATIDQWLEIVEEIYDWARPDETLRFLLVCGSIQQPLRYAYARARDFAVRHPNGPYTRTAVLLEQTLIFSIVAAMARDIPTTERNVARVFTTAQRDKALAWLLARDESPLHRA